MGTARTRQIFEVVSLLTQIFHSLVTEALFQGASAEAYESLQGPELCQGDENVQLASAKFQTAPASLIVPFSKAKTQSSSFQKILPFVM